MAKSTVKKHSASKGCFSKMKPLSQSWYYWIMAALLIAQVSLSVVYHTLLCNMLTANTLLLLIVTSHHGYHISENAERLFYRICGCVTFVAVLFVNSTHAMEMLSDFGGSEDHDHSHHNHGEDYSFIPDYYAFVAICDGILKCMILVLGYVPHMGLNFILRFLFHTLAPLAVVVYYVLGLTISSRIGESWLWKHADPITTVILTVILILLILPGFKEMMPYIFAENPQGFDEDSFKLKVTGKFSNVTISHIHVYRQWPGKKFEALLHIDIKVKKSEKLWSENGARIFQQVIEFVEEELKQLGASKIVMEPRFLDENEDSEWIGCVAENCHRRDRGCCGGKTSNPSTTSSVSA